MPQDKNNSIPSHSFDVGDDEDVHSIMQSWLAIAGLRLTFAPPVSAQPAVKLERWQMLGIRMRSDIDKISSYLAGFNVADEKFRVSTEVVEINQKQRWVRTRSGRFYYLIGEPGFDSINHKTFGQ